MNVPTAARRTVVLRIVVYFTMVVKMGIECDGQYRGEGFREDRSPPFPYHFLRRRTGLSVTAVPPQSGAYKSYIG